MKKRAEEEKCCWCEQPSSKLCSPAVGLHRYSVRLNGVPAFVSKFRQQFCQKTGFWSLPELLQGTVNKQNTQLVLFFHCFTSGEGEGFKKFAVKHTDAIIWNCFLRLSETDYQGSMGKYFLNSLKLLKSLKCKGDQEWGFFCCCCWELVFEIKNLNLLRITVDHHYWKTDPEIWRGTDVMLCKLFFSAGNDFPRSLQCGQAMLSWDE